MSEYTLSETGGELIKSLHALACSTEGGARLV